MCFDILYRYPDHSLTPFRMRTLFIAQLPHELFTCIPRHDTSIIFIHIRSKKQQKHYSKNKEQHQQQQLILHSPRTMPHCDNCDCYLASNRAIEHHLEEAHGLHVRLGSDSHLAYCEDCHKYLGHGPFVEMRKALEKHLLQHHNVDIQG